MAYTVGSASVEIVPDFRRAQIEITRFFNSQPDKFTVPVRADVDEAQARVAGAKLGKAVEEGTARARAAGDREAVQAARAREQAVTRAHGEALRIQAQMDRDAAREQERLNRTLQQSITSAHAEALRMQAAMDKAAEQERLASLRATMREVEQQAARELQIERDAQRERERIAKAEQEFAVRSARETMRQTQAFVAARAKAENDAAKEAAQQRAQAFRDEERQFRDHLKSQIAAMKAAQRDASREEKIKLQVEIDQRQAILDARTTGGLIARSIHAEVRQNAGLIAAVVGGALLAGAPATAAAATALFAGIGAAAALQNNQLRQSWAGLWQDIKSQAVRDAAVLVPAYDRMAGSIGLAFRRIRPDVQDTFTALVPQIDSFSASVTRAAENALPGLTRSVQAGMPITQGFGDLIERTGTGISAFFDRITAHAPAAGSAFRELGSSIQVALPLLGELLGQGAETASLVLPALTQSLEGAHTVVNALSGALPALLSGFLAFRLVQGAARFITGWSQSLGMASIAGGQFSSGLGRASGALSTLGRALPVVGVAVGAVGAAMAAAEATTDGWVNALLRGGAAARQAQKEAQLASQDDFVAIGQWLNLVDTWEDVEAEAAKVIAAMTPLERANYDLDVATRALAEANGKQGTSASELADLQGAVAEASARAAREQERLEMATRGVTEAMAEQADAARARVDADFAYQQSVLDLAEAQNDLKKAMEGTYDTEAEKIAAVQQATLDLNKAMQDQVSAAESLATSKLPASMDDTQKKIIGAKAALDEMNSLIAQGFTLPPAMEAYRQSLIAITGGAEGAQLAQAQLVAALAEVGIAAEAIPGTKVIEISADDAPLVRDHLIDLGFTVTTLPDGSIRVEAKTEEAQANLGNLSTTLAGLDATTAEPGITLIDGQFQTIASGVQGLLTKLTNTTAQPGATLVDKGFIGPVQNDQNQMGILGRMHAMPGATLVDRGFMGPVAMDQNMLNTLGRSHAMPAVTLRDYASGGITAIQSYLNGLRDRTVTVTLNQVTNQIVRRSTVNADPYLGGAAQGGAVEDIPLRKFDGGGAVIGPGGPRDDLIPAYGPEGRPNYRIANGEHILDALDVLLMGGQPGVYAFREALNSRAFGSPGPDTAVRAMVASGGAPAVAASPAPSGPPVHIYTPDYREAIRRLEENRHREAVLASPWRGR